jgi:hypothetical protein
LQQLGVTTEAQDPDQRGILKLSPTSIFDAVPTFQDPSPEQLVESNWLEFIADDRFTDGFMSGQAIAFCSSCIAGVPDYLITAPKQAAIFTDAINATGSPAMAVQALNTLFARMAYYDSIPVFDHMANVPTSLIVYKPVPRAHIGYWVVITMIFFQLFLIGFIASAFEQTRYSLLQDSWHVLAQIANTRSLNVLELIAHAPMASDTEIKDQIHDKKPSKWRQHCVQEVREWFNPPTRRRYVINEGVLVEGSASGSFWQWLRRRASSSRKDTERLKE